MSRPYADIPDASLESELQRTWRDDARQLDREEKMEQARQDPNHPIHEVDRRNEERPK